MGNSPPSAVIRGGAEFDRVHLTDVEAALRDPGRKGQTEPHNLAEHVLLLQLKQARRARRLIDRRITRELKDNRQWCPDTDLVEAIAKLMQATRAGFAEWRALRKFSQDARKGLTDEQLDRVLVHNLRRIAPKLTDEQWWDFIAAKFGDAVANVLVPRKEAV